MLKKKMLISTVIIAMMLASPVCAEEINQTVNESSQMAVGFNAAPAQAADETIHIAWDGVELEFPDQQPMIVDGRTLTPPRPITAAMPGDYMVNVVQDKPWYAVSIQPTDNNIEGKNWFEFYQAHDGEAAFCRSNLGQTQGERLEMPIEIIGNRFMLPVRVLAEPFGDVSWDGATKTVTVTTKNVVQ